MLNIGYQKYYINEEEAFGEGEIHTGPCILDEISINGK